MTTPDSSSSARSAIAIAVCVAALLWAAIQDGREAQAFRSHRALR
jgi:hypothetical protein